VDLSLANLDLTLYLATLSVLLAARLSSRQGSPLGRLDMLAIAEEGLDDFQRRPCLAFRAAPLEIGGQFTVRAQNFLFAKFLSVRTIEIGYSLLGGTHRERVYFFLSSF
jgi:hypothetical protein